MRRTVRHLEISIRSDAVLPNSRTALELKADRIGVTRRIWRERNRHLLPKCNLFVMNPAGIASGIVVQVLREDGLHRKQN